MSNEKKLSILQPVDRMALTMSLMSQWDSDLAVSIETEEGRERVIVTGIEKEDGSGFLYNVKGRTLDGLNVKLFVNTKHTTKTHGCIIFEAR